jgi:hypothetical protein
LPAPKSLRERVSLIGSTPAVQTKSTSVTAATQP